MKKMLSMMLALLMLFSLAACGGGDSSGESGGGENQVAEEYVQITNKLGVDLTNLTISAEDGSGSTLVAETFNDGETYQFSLVDVCGDLEGWVDITAYNEAGDLYKINGLIYDGIEADMVNEGYLRIEFPYNDTIAQCSGEIIPNGDSGGGSGGGDEPDHDPSEQNAEDFYGEWEYYDFPSWLNIYGDGTFQVTNNDGETLSGTYHMDDGLLVLDDMDMSFYLDGNGNLIDSDGDTLVRPDSGGSDEDEDPDGNYGYSMGDYQGYWMYDNGYLLLIEDGNWGIFDDAGDLFATGPVEYEDDGAYLMTEDGSSGGGKVSFDADGDLWDGDEMLTYYDESPYALDTSTGGNSENQQYDMIADEWYYSDQENILTLYADGTYLWEFPDFNEFGNYTFDGEYLNFYPTENNAWWPEAVYNSDEDIIIATGDAGSWYYRSSEF